MQTAYVLSYSVIMLNTDQHNPTVKRRMTGDDFVRNNRGIDDERDLPREFLEDLYTRIKTRQIMMRHTMIESRDEGGDGETKYELDASWMESIFALFGRIRELRSEPTEGQIVQLEEFLKVRRALCLEVVCDAPPTGSLSAGVVAAVETAATAFEGGPGLVAYSTSSSTQTSTAASTSSNYLSHLNQLVTTCRRRHRG